MKRNSLLTLSAIQTMAGKAIRDIRTGGKRETRNILNVCRSYARDPQQQEIWDIIKGFLAAPDNRYQALLHRAATCVREDLLKTLAINLSCTAFSSGRDRLYMQTPQEGELRWLQWLEPADNLQDEICAWTQKGITVFLVNMREYADRFRQLAELSVCNSRCIFICTVCDCGLDLSWSVHSDNICFLLTPDVIDSYAPFLLHHKLFFGILRDYSNVQDLHREGELLEHWAETGCLICVYHSRLDHTAQTHDEKLYSILRHIRRKGRSELFLCDLDRDSALIQNILLDKEPDTVSNSTYPAQRQ